MFNSLRAIKPSAPLPRILLGSAIALVLALALWLVLTPVAPGGNAVVAAPNLPPPIISGLAVTNDGPKVVNEPITFTASVTQGTVATYTWDFGDGNSDSGADATISHAYTESGVYTASVVAANDTSAETATTTVYVGDAVVTLNDNNDTFVPKNVTIPVGGTVIWVRPNGTHSVTADDDSFEQPLGNSWTLFSHTFNSAGTVPYYCKQHGGKNGAGMAGTVVVQAPTEPIAGLSAGNFSPATINTPIEFTTTVTSGNNITYTWDFGDGIAQAPITAVTTTHAYTAPGIYTATVTAVNISSTVVATTTAYVGNAVVEVKDNFYAPASVTIPAGGTVVWVLRGTHSHSVTADDHSFEQPAGNNWPPFVHTFATVAASDVTTVTYHCTVHSGMKGTVVISSLPPAVGGLTAENDGPAQVLTPVSFTAHVTSGTGITYTWDFGDGGTGEDITTTHTYTQSGIYTATVTATNATNSQKATTTVYVGDAIVDVSDFKFDPQTVTIPQGGRVVWVLRGGTHGVVADDNSFEGPTGSSWDPYVHIFTAAGSYPYHCTVHGLSMRGTVIVTGTLQNILMPRISQHPTR
jgi:plastocyanin